jgi:ADP-L-glycero-D-manno-heptose 6-epimerase
MIAVTGGAGFIGSALIWGLNQRGQDDILVVDELGTGESWRNLVNLRFADFMDKTDFLDRLEHKELSGALEGILHLGACSSTTEPDVGFLIRNNTQYTQRLARWALAQKKRFVYASSAATYGDGSLGFSDDHALLSRLRPLNGYAFSKSLFDAWALRQGLLEKIAGLKFFNVFGPNEYHKADMRSVVHKAFAQIRAVGQVKLFKSYHPDYKDGWQMRDFVYVKDVVAMTLFVYESPRANGIFNVGAGQARSFYDLVAAVFAALGRQPSIELIDMPEELRAKYQYFTQADMGKLARAGFTRPRHTLEEAVRDYVQNYLLAPDPYLK